MKFIFPPLLIHTIILAAEPKTEYQLNHKAQKVSSAILNNDSRTIYELFVPAFRQEIEFFRFDSALKAWVKNRRIAQINTRLIEIRGRGGHISTYVTFQGKQDYEYIYGNWLFTDSGWQLVWLSNILDQTFQYGSRDTLSMFELADVALEHILSPTTRKLLRINKLDLSETLYALLPMINRETTSISCNRPVVWLPGNTDISKRIPKTVPYYLEFGQIRIFGSFARTAIDIKPRSSFGLKMIGRRRGIELYLKISKQKWTFDSTGKTW